MARAQGLKRGGPKLRRSHTFSIHVTFDRTCTRAWALGEVRDTIHGEFYTTQRDVDREPGSYRVRSIRRDR
jgi:hypothetical protein